MRCAICHQVVDYFGERLLHVYPPDTRNGDHAAVKAASDAN
jgi:hypothetical protein